MREVPETNTNTTFCVRLWKTAAATDTLSSEILGYTAYIRMELTAMETTPPVKLYKREETFPAKTAPKSVLANTTINASIGEYIISAIKEKAFASPNFAPGIKIGGNKFSIRKATRLKAVRTPNAAILPVLKIFARSCLFITIIIYQKEKLVNTSVQKIFKNKYKSSHFRFILPIMSKCLS